MKSEATTIAAIILAGLMTTAAWAEQRSDSDGFIASHIDWLVAAQTTGGLTGRDCILLGMLNPGAPLPPECEDPGAAPPEPEGPTAMTIWWVVFNAPENCSDTPCPLSDLPEPDVQASVFYATGTLADDEGRAMFVASLYETDSDAFAGLDDNTSIAGPSGLLDAQHAEVQAVVRTHGPADLDDQEGLTEKLSGFLSSDCEDAGGDFPCANIQIARHPSGESGISPLHTLADGEQVEGATSQLVREPGAIKLIINTYID